jgi:hypothetical protein
VRGFPKMPPESSRLPGTEPASQARAASYATRAASTVIAEPAITPMATSQPGTAPFRRSVAGPDNAARRAAGYAVRPRSTR